MSVDRASVAPTPAHVPAELVRDIDIYSLPGLVDGRTDDIHAIWKHIQDTHPPIFWTPRNGGHWMLTRYDVMRTVGTNANQFSNCDIFVPKGTAPFLTPTNMDPPQHTAFRNLLMPTFSPASLARAADQARNAAVSIIEQLRPKGRCEFVDEFSSVMPIVAFMSLVNLPTDDLAFLRKATDDLSPTNIDPMQGWAPLSAYVEAQINLRRANPQDDFISSLLQAKVDGRPLTPEQIFSMTLLVISGGLDTVKIALSFAAAFLAQNPKHRRELIEHPERIDNAVEELFRRFGVSNIARVAKDDCEIDGVDVKKGESILLVYPLAGLDESKTRDPLTVDFSREQPRHLIFGSGVHTCIGNRLARRELRLFLREWLSRIPDFEIAPETRPVETTGVTNYINELHLVWPV